MDKEKKMTPEIRFPRFTGNWGKFKVSDLFKVTRGYTLAAPETDKTPSNYKPYPVYSSQTKNNGLMGYYKDYLYEDAITWTTDGANAGTVNYRHGKFYCTNVCGVLLSDEGYSNKMVAEALNIIAWKYVSKVGNPKLMNNIMSEIEVYLPKNITEQNKISEFMINIDNAITLYQHQLDDIKLYKKGLLQKMFPKKGEKVPELRFPGFAGDWERKKLGDIVDFQDNMRKPLKECDRKSGPYPYYGASGIIDYVEDYIFNEESILLSEDGANITDRNYPVCFLASDKYWVNNHAHVLKAHSKMDNNFICMSMERKDYTNYNTGMAMPKLNKDTCYQIPVDCPSFDEQKKIGDYFRQIDTFITLQQHQIDDMKEYKKGLLQKMFI